MPGKMKTPTKESSRERAELDFIKELGEADALFAKRTEISSSNDKYANNEVAFLLQKIEEFDGFIILATNVYSNFDPAFIRRITYCILMEKPQPQTRVEMLRGMLPPQTPVDPNLQLENMANNFELTGSEMKAVVLYNYSMEKGELTNDDKNRSTAENE